MIKWAEFKQFLPSKLNFNLKMVHPPTFYPICHKIFCKIQFSTFAFPLFPDFNQIVPYILRKDDLYAIPRFKMDFMFKQLFGTQAESQSRWRF